MPLLSLLPDRQGMTLFVAIHVPLFALIIGAVASHARRMRRLVRLVISGFLLIHAVLHYWYSDAPTYEFNSVLSSALIYGGAGLGGVYLLLHYLVDVD